jgi:hypothetical protein
VFQDCVCHFCHCWRSWCSLFSVPRHSFSVRGASPRATPVRPARRSESQCGAARSACQCRLKIPHIQDRNRQIIGTHTLKIGCVCTDENATCTARNLLKTMDTKSFPRVCSISTTTLNSVSSRTCPHTREWDLFLSVRGNDRRRAMGRKCSRFDPPLPSLS